MFDLFYRFQFISDLQVYPLMLYICKTLPRLFVFLEAITMIPSIRSCRLLAMCYFMFTLRYLDLVLFGPAADKRDLRTYANSEDPD